MNPYCSGKFFGKKIVAAGDSVIKKSGYWLYCNLCNMAFSNKIIDFVFKFAPQQSPIQVP